MTKIQKLFLVIFLCQLGNISAAVACIWDTSTLQDEMMLNPNAFHLITGQFPHHGIDYYQDRVQRSQATLKESPEDVIVRNDLAVALLKLKQYDEALAEFKRIEKLAPNRYETASNLGVLYKKMGDYSRAAKFIRQALKIKPEGHLGLGDFYLKMLQWKHDNSQRSTIDKNFRGIPYSKIDSGCLKLEHCKEKLYSLIRSDRTFSDALLLLGDTLYSSGENNLALWAYIRAQQLGHPRLDIIKKRIDRIFEDWNRTTYSLQSKQYVEGQIVSIAKIQLELKEAQQWVLYFQQIEGELIDKNGGTNFDAVKTEMLNRSIFRNRPENIGVKAQTKWNTVRFWLIVGFILLMILALFLILVKRTWTQIRRIKASKK